MKLLQVVTLCAAMVFSITGCAGRQNNVEVTTVNVNQNPKVAEEYYTLNFTITDDYDVQCPFGDAVIVDRNEMDFLGKPVGDLVECVNYDAHSKQWVTWNTNGRNEKMYQVWPPKQYRVFTMDGELVVKNGKPVTCSSKES